MISPWPENWPKEIEVFQAHYARNIVIEDPGFSMELLQDIKPKYAKATLNYRNAGVIETISHPHSKKVSKHSFYDKYRERERLLKSKKRYKDFYKAVSTGTKRYEVQVPRAELKKVHHGTLDIFTVERILKATKKNIGVFQTMEKLLTLNFMTINNYDFKLNIESPQHQRHSQNRVYLAPICRSFLV